MTHFSEIAGLLKEASRRGEETRARMQTTSKNLEGFAAYLTRITAEVAQMQHSLCKDSGD